MVADAASKLLAKAVSLKSSAIGTWQPGLAIQCIYAKTIHRYHVAGAVACISLQCAPDAQVTAAWVRHPRGCYTDMASRWQRLQGRKSVVTAEGLHAHIRVLSKFVMTVFIPELGRRPDSTLYPTAQTCAAAGVPQLIHILNAAQLTRMGHVDRMPGGSVLKQLLFAKGRVGLGGVVGRPHYTWRDRALAALRRVSRAGWRGGVGMGWLRTVRSGVRFVTASSQLLDPLCLAALNTGIPFVDPLPKTLTLTLTLFSNPFVLRIGHASVRAGRALPLCQPCLRKILTKF
eukprot:363869-Chlamydomonas_euryale.AAC.28